MASSQQSVGTLSVPWHCAVHQLQIMRETKRDGSIEECTWLLSLLDASKHQSAHGSLDLFRRLLPESASHMPPVLYIVYSAKRRLNLRLDIDALGDLIDTKAHLLALLFPG